MNAAEVIELLGLAPLEQEGGLHAQTYASDTLTQGGECAGTAIYYLLEEGEFSHLHRLTGDEVYHFYLGDAVELVELDEEGSGSVTILGKDLAAGQQVQHVVKAGTWQGSRLVDGGKWALMGTTMCPGYSDASYTHGNAEELLANYPEWADAIRRLTR